MYVYNMLRSRITHAKRKHDGLTSAQRIEVPVNELKTWTAMMQRCERHMGLHGLHSADQLNTLDADLKGVTDTWIMRLKELSANELSAKSTSISDVLFVLRCHMLYLASKREDRPRLTIAHELHSLFAEIRVAACQHTPTSASHYPPEETWKEWQMKMASVVVVYMHTEPGDESHPPVKLPRVGSELREKVDALRHAWQTPSGEESKTLNEDEDGINAGGFWESKTFWSRMVPLCSCIFSKAELDARLLRMYPVVTYNEPIYPPGAPRKMHAWLLKMAAMEQSDAFLAAHREVCMDEMIPFGMRSMLFRTWAIGGDKMAQSQLDDLLGTPTSVAIGEMCDTDVDKISTDKVREQTHTQSTIHTSFLRHGEFH